MQAKPRILDFMIKINEMEAMEEFKDAGRGIIAPHCDMGSSLSRLNYDVKTCDTTLLIGSKKDIYSSYR